MPQQKHNSPLALAYAQAILELANEHKQAETLGAELDQIKLILAANPNFHAFLADPAISETERGQALERIFKGQVTPLLFNFLRVLNAKGRAGILTQVINAYGDLLAAQLGNIDVDLVVAHPLSDTEVEEVRAKVSLALKKNALLHQRVDESIIGGLVLRVEDRLLDGSITTQLKMLRDQMLAAGPK